MVNRLIFTTFLIFVSNFSCDQYKSADTSAGDNWQLFIDDDWISNSDKVIKTLHQPIKHPGNPLIRGDDPWAENPYCFGSVIYDENESLFKIWYMSYNYGRPVADRTPILYATSINGIQWTRPNLGIIEFQDSKDNNIILTNYGHHDLYSPSVIKDIAATDPDRRYKMIWWDFPLGTKGYQDDGMCVAFSPDGVLWKKYPGNPVLPAKKSEQSISDVMSVMQDQRTGRFVAYTKGWAEPWPAFRQIVRTESSDFINWSEPKVVIRHKYDIQDPQSYGMTVTQVGNLYIGLMCSYKKPGDETIDIQLAISHDNSNWKRVANQETFLPNGPSGSWDSGMIFTAPFINHGDQTMIYYGGWNGPHNQNKDRHSGIGLATLRKNGFVSLDTGLESGFIITQTMQNFQGPLLVNADASRGSMIAELLDVEGNPIPGYTAKECLSVQGDGLEQPIRWRDYSELPKDEKTVRIRFLMTRTSLYGFFAGATVTRFN